MPAEIQPSDSGFVLTMDGQAQSHVDLDDPGRLAFDYVRRIGDALDAWGEPGAPMRVLHVGGGALTLPRYLAHTRPRSAQVVLEPAADVTELVRRELPLPRHSGIKVRPVDGRTGLTAFRDGSLDVVVVDAFERGRVPADLVTAECAAAYARVLSPGGLLLLNLVDTAPFAWTRRVVAAVKNTLPALVVSGEPATLRGRRAGNLLLVAGSDSVPVEALDARAASGAAPYRVLAGPTVSDTLGGGRPFTDADIQPSRGGYRRRMSAHSTEELEAIQAVVDRVTSWQDGATEGTVAEELRKGFSEAGVDVADDDVAKLADAIEDEHGAVRADDVLG